MSAQKTPRQRLRRLVKRGDPPTPPLFVPAVHAVAALIEGWDVESFLSDPTKLSRGLTSLHDMLATDGIVCFNAAGVVAEALGAELDWSDYPPRPATAPTLVATETPEQLIERVLSHPRVVTGMEVVRRLSVTAEGEPLFAAIMTGPATLATQLGAATGASAQSWPTGLLELCARIDVELCRAFGEAGTHVFVLAEDMVPTHDDGQVYEPWLSALTSIMNVIRFYQALPVLLPRVPAAAAKGLAASAFDNKFLCLGDDVASADEVALGRALSGPPAAWAAPGGGFGLLTTTTEVAPTTEIGDLNQACASVRAGLEGTL